MYKTHTTVKYCPNAKAAGGYFSCTNLDESEEEDENDSYSREIINTLETDNLLLITEISDLGKELQIEKAELLDCQEKLVGFLSH